jgi:hypothetical protein
MNLASRGELRRAMLAQLESQQCGGLHVDAIVSAFVEQLIGLRDSYEHEVARFQVTPIRRIRAMLLLYRNAATLGAICPSTVGRRG